MFKTSSNSDIVMRKEVIITDWDGVLQMIDKAWCYLIKTQKEILEPWFNYELLESYGTKDFITSLFNRKEYYLNDWLLRDDVEDIPREVFRFFMGLYTECDFFYDGCDWLAMMEVLSGMSRQNCVSEIIILTHVPYKNKRDYRKEKLFRELIQPVSSKFKLVQLHTSESKADWIKNNKPNFTIFIDDRADIIKEVTNKNKIKDKMIYMPIYGYNKHLLDDEDYIVELTRRGCILYGYAVQVIPGKDEKDNKERFNKDSMDLYSHLNDYMNKKSRKDFEEMNRFKF